MMVNLNDNTIMMLVLADLREQFKPIVIHIAVTRHTSTNNSYRLIYRLVFQPNLDDSGFMDVDVSDGVLSLWYGSAECVVDLIEPDSLDKMRDFIRKIKSELAQTIINAYLGSP